MCSYVFLCVPLCYEVLMFSYVFLCVMKNWHAIYVKSRTEKKVGEALEARNIEAYVPVVKTMRQWSDRKKMVELPLLNGYVFVNITLKEQDVVLQTRGVVNFVRSEKKI